MKEHRLIWQNVVEIMNIADKLKEKKIFLTACYVSHSFNWLQHAQARHTQGKYLMKTFFFGLI